MSKLLEALLADGRAATHKCAFPWTHAEWRGAGNVNFYSGTDGYVAFALIGVLGEATKGERVTRAEFDAAMKQYPSSTQGEIVQPEPNHAFLERICLSANLVVDDMTLDHVCEALKAADKAHSDFTDTAIAEHELLARICDVLGVPEGADPVRHAETLKHNNEQLIRAANAAESALTGLLDKMGCKGTDEALEKYRVALHGAEMRDGQLKSWEAYDRELRIRIADTLAYTINTFHPGKAPEPLAENASDRLDQLTAAVRGIPTETFGNEIQTYRNELHGLFLALDLSGGDENYEGALSTIHKLKSDAHRTLRHNVDMSAFVGQLRKDSDGLSRILTVMGCSNVEEAEEKYLSVATLPEHGLKKVLAAAEVTNADDAVSIIHMLQSYMVENPSPTQANLLHGGQLYRNATVLLHTEQLIVWRDADEQEHSAPAHQVTINPDDNGLAAAILSLIGSYEVAPEHIAEMRQQMGWNDEA